MRRETWTHPGAGDYVAEVTDAETVSLYASTLNELTRVQPAMQPAGDAVTVFLPYSMFVTLMTHWGWTLRMEEAPLDLV
jgi:hypothetical protein